MAISHADLVDGVSVVAARAVAGPTLTLATGKGALVAAGSPTPDAPMPIVVYRGSTFLTILRCEGVAGDVLAINGTMFGKADASINVGDAAYNAPTAGDLKALWDAVAAVSTTPGPQGDPGSVWRDGSGAPASTLGVDGDYYLDDATGDVYLKASGAYSIVADIKGAQGDQGPKGDQGDQGPAGVGSFGLSMPSGLTVTNSPLTSGGTIVVSTTLAGVLKGTGSGLAAAVAGTDYVAPGGNITGTASNVTGVVGVDHGGTGLTTPGSANQVLGADATGVGLEHKTLVAGSNVTITHGAGTVTIAAAGGSGGGGTLSSVGLTMPGGLAVAGSPLTADGTIAVTTALSGLVKAGSGSFSAAVAGTDYVTPSGSIAGTAGNVTGTVAVAHGGTGLTTLGAANQVLAVNAAGTALEYHDPPSGSGGGSSAYDMRFVLAQGEDLAVGTNLTGNGVIATRAGTLPKVKIIAKTNGAGGGFTLDIKKNGVSIFTTPPTVTASTTTVQTFTPDVVDFAEDDEFTPDCTAVGGAGIRNVLVTLAGLTAVV